MRFLFLALLALTTTVSAQTLPAGQWAGELVWSNAEPVALSATIETCALGLKIRLVSDDELYRTADTIIAPTGPVEFTVRNTQRGYTLNCSLTRQDDESLAGSCSRGSSQARMTLHPPEQSTIGCSE